jgi:L-lysine 6-transaminase
MINPEKVHEVLGKRILLEGMDMVLDLRRSKGMWLYDSRFDRWLLDFFGFFATSALGMNHPSMEEPEFQRKLLRAAVNRPSNCDVYTEEYAEFVDTLSKVATPPYFKYFFFIEGGALGVENALKVAFDWKVRKNLKERGKEMGYKVIHLRESFHGRSGYTLSMTNTFDKRKTMYFPKFNWPRITNPKITFPLEGENLKRVEELERQSLAEAEKAIKENDGDVAAFIMEPIQGEGGDNHFRGEYIRAVRELTERYDIMFIVDEVQSGMGITGKWWAHEYFDVEPDVMVFGKKTRISGIMVGPRVDEVEENVFKVPSRISSTWGGNLADMVVATKIIEVIDNDKLLDNAVRRGQEIIRGLMELSERYELSNVRGRGLMIAVDLPDSRKRDMTLSKLYKNGMIALPCGEKGIRFRPPLIIGSEEVQEGLNRLERSLRES